MSVGLRARANPIESLNAALSSGRVLQRKYTCPGSSDLEGECDECRAGLVQRSPAGFANSTAAPAIVHDVVQSQGRPLDDRTRSFMDPRFGHDFSRVRVHTDARAGESAEAIGAHAYTLGSDIVFGAGAYAPRTARGLRLLAHELVHVLQQEGEGPLPTDALTIGPAGDRHETEADRAADEVLADRAPRVPPFAGRGVSRLSRVPRGSLQRAVKFVPGTVSEELNVADLLATGHRFLGNTDYVLNGTAFTSATTAQQNRGALNTPQFNSAAAPRGGGVECSIQSVPDNEASYAMQIPTTGPWTAATTTAAILALFPGLAPCSTVAAGPVNLTVRGDPSHDAVKRHVRTHEDHHAADFKTITQNILVPWDKKLNDAKTAGKKMVAKDQGHCETIFYAQFVGQQQRPDDIVDAIVNQVNATGVAFHGTAAGKNVQIRNIQADAQCKNVTTDAKP